MVNEGLSRVVLLAKCGIALILTAIPALALTEQQRIERLEMLADIWGKVYLFHPRIVTTRIDWPQVLIATIPKIERAASTDDLVTVLNESLFGPLDDPLTRAQRRLPAAADPNPRALAGRKLSATVAYLDATHPQMYGRDAAKQVPKVLQSLGPVEVVVVDLRFPVPSWADLDWLRLFIPSQQVTGARIGREHHGWNEYNTPFVYRQKWNVEPGSILQPFAKGQSIRIPAVFVVNKSSYDVSARTLDALQSAGTAAVVLEGRGRFLSGWGLGRYPEDVEVRLDFPMLVSRSGNLGAHPDHVSTDVLSDADLVSLAGRLTGNKSGQTPAPSNSFSLDMRFPDLVPPSDRALSREERLLGLFKVWTVISYLDPHVSLASINWETALREYIPKVEAAGSGTEYYAVLRRLTALLNDSHVRVSNPAHEWKAILPLSLQPIEGKPIIVATIPSPTGEEPPVKIGDEVVAIDGKPVQETIAASEAFISGSTPGARQRDAMASLVGQRKVAFLVGQRKDTVELQLRNEEGTRTLTLKSVPPRRPAHSQPSYKVLPGNLGYMDLDNLVENEMEPALQAVAGTNGLILDMRGYPRFRIWTSLIPHLIERRSQWNLFEVPIASGPNRLLRVTSQLTAWLEPSPTEIYRKPIAVLIDEFTQSAAEHFCILMRIARRATFVGSTTAGADGDVARITLPDGGTMIFTGGRIKFPDGSPFQNVGIIPDIKVEPTVRGIRAGRDEVLEKAVDLLTSMK